MIQPNEKRIENLTNLSLDESKHIQDKIDNTVPITQQIKNP